MYFYSIQSLFFEAKLETQNISAFYLNYFTMGFKTFLSRIKIFSTIEYHMLCNYIGGFSSISITPLHNQKTGSSTLIWMV